VTSIDKHQQRWALCRVYTCKFENQVPNGNLKKSIILVAKVAQYFVCKEERKLALYCKLEI